ncbi:hypothetical protein FB45DRAFT_934148 [Roridomyces roridus]|uniref:Uncharacterized protein n=1 Tax=Roridomyces roridus TaxID=1738132 RepID=A0AAD7BBR4_9AGAR|nr:hypothetical protein FB45DRAFT_934148 [Roridomyces roridus]
MCEGTYGTGGRGRRIRQMRRTPFGLDLPRQQNCTTRVRALEEEARRCSFYDAPILKRDKVESLDGLESEVRCCSGDRHAFSYDVWLRLQSDRCAVERDGEMQSFEDELWTGNEGALEVVPDGMGNFEDGEGGLTWNVASKAGESKESILRHGFQPTEADPPEYGPRVATNLARLEQELKRLRDGENQLRWGFRGGLGAWGRVHPVERRCLRSWMKGKSGATRGGVFLENCHPFVEELVKALQELGRPRGSYGCRRSVHSMWCW